MGSWPIPGTREIIPILAKNQNNCRYGYLLVGKSKERKESGKSVLRCVQIIVHYFDL